MGGEDIRKLRESLKLTRPEFASQFGLNAATLRQWEYGRRLPNEAARVLLSVISCSPEAVKKAISITSN